MVLQRNLVLTIFFACAILSSCSSNHKGIPLCLKTNYYSNPLGIDDSTPRFSWQLGDTGRAVEQSAYQILVSSDKDYLSSGHGDLWNSGKVVSSDCQFITYNGSPLNSSKRYFWKVKYWDYNGIESSWSEMQWFETAFLKEADWKAQWICSREPVTKNPPASIYVRKEFTLKDVPVQARVYVTGLGNYVLSVNGSRAGNDLLTPGWTDYRQKVQYQIYDITNLLAKGHNAAGMLVGNMWWSSGLGWNGGAVYSRGPLMVLAQIQVIYPDGTEEIVCTDSTWKYNFSPIISNHIYDGEHYDARMEIQGWDKPGLDDSAWKNMKPENHINLNLVAQQGNPIRVTQTLPSISVSQPQKGVYVFDMGQNMVGTAKIHVSGKAGDQIIIKYAELLHPDGTVAQENLRTAKATDLYMFKSDGVQDYVTTFTYHGFRYVQISGLREMPDTSAVTGLVFHSDAPPTGHFNCSNELLNKIWKNITWGQISNMMSVPTDCPQRDERLGWMGDAQIFAPTADFNMNMNAFFAKWERDIIDCQDSSGAVTDVNPAIVVTDVAKPGWGDAVVAIPYQTYRFYGDREILEKSYEGMLKWVRFMEKNSTNYLYEFGSGPWGGYGDWVAVTSSPTKPIGALYYYYSTKLTATMAGILGKKDDSIRLAQLLPKIAEAYQVKYFRPDSGHYISNTQTMNLLPVAFGITPENLRPEVMEKVVEDVEIRGNHLSTGFLGTAWLLPLLSEYGYHELAYKVATQSTYPSWGYMIEKGATTMWELWNSDTEKPEAMNSRNHFAYGSVGEWFYQYLAGINPDLNEPGFKHTVIKPMPAGDLSHAFASLETGYGKLSASWKKENGLFSLDLVIPANTTATVTLPGAGTNEIFNESGLTFFKEGKVQTLPAGVQFKGLSNGEVTVEVGSGIYHFSVQ